MMKTVGAMVGSFWQWLQLHSRQDTSREARTPQGVAVRYFEG